MKEKELYKEIFKQNLTLPTDLSAEEILQKKVSRKRNSYVRTSRIKYFAAAAAITAVLVTGVWYFNSKKQVLPESADNIITSSESSYLKDQDSDLSNTAETDEESEELVLYRSVMTDFLNDSTECNCQVIRYFGTSDMNLSINDREVSDRLAAGLSSTVPLVKKVVTYLDGHVVNYIGKRIPGKEGKGELSETDYDRLFMNYTDMFTISNSISSFSGGINTLAYTVIDDEVYVCLYDSHPNSSDAASEYYYKLVVDNIDKVPFKNTSESAMLFSLPDWSYSKEYVSVGNTSDIVLEDLNADLNMLFKSGEGGNVVLKADLKGDYPVIKVENIVLNSEEKIADYKLTVRIYAFNEFGQSYIVENSTNDLSEPVDFSPEKDDLANYTIESVRIRIEFDTDKHSTPEDRTSAEYAYELVTDIGEKMTDLNI